MMVKSAVLDVTGKYRYDLRRIWGGGPELGWIMLNPSTADAEQDDPTIRRCIAFSQAWGFGSLRVVNLFAYRATDPRVLWSLPAEEAIGPENDEAICQARRECPHLVAAWGAAPQAAARARSVLALGDISRPFSRIWCLGRTKDGYPRHPLYVPGETWPKVYGQPPSLKAILYAL